MATCNGRDAGAFTGNDPTDMATSVCTPAPDPGASCYYPAPGPFMPHEC